MSRVFIPHEVLQRNPESGNFERKMDLSTAAQYGELTYLLEPGRPPNDPALYLPTLRAGLATFTPDDLLLPIGHPAVVAYCSALAARASGGHLRLLVWNRRLGQYIVTPDVLLWPEPASAPLPQFAPCHSPANWQIWSHYHRAWWRADAAGYTVHREAAGLYTYEEAHKFCNARSGPDAPYELMINKNVNDELIAPLLKL